MKCRIVFISILTICLMLVSASEASSQTCPENMVCISREAALKALADADRVKALEIELKALKEQAIPDLKSLLADMRVNYAECKGESTILKQRAVSDAALIELFSKLAKPKQIGLINFKL